MLKCRLGQARLLLAQMMECIRQRLAHAKIHVRRSRSRVCRGDAHMNKREVSAQGARQHQGGAEHLPVGRCV